MKIFLGAIVFYIAMISAVYALDIQKINGHEISIKEVDYEKVLSVDGREMHRNMYVSFDEMTTITDVPVIIGSSSNGGNACDSSPFVLSVPAGGKARFDGPLESCSTISHTVENDKVIFKSVNIPGQGQQNWEWTPSNGFKEIGTIAFKAKDTSGWNALRERSIQYPFDVLDNIEISNQIKTLLGGDFSLYQSILIGPGTGEYKRGDYVGQSCAAHQCGSQEGIIFLSQSDKQVYAALKPDGQKIRVYPPMKTWPSKAKYELKAWANKWK